MKTTKTKKKFIYRDVEMRIVEVEKEYLNSGKMVKYLRVIAPNDKILPIQIQHKETLKSIQKRSIEMMDTFIKMGATLRELTEN